MKSDQAESSGVDYYQFRDLHVRNLAWAIASSPLWQPDAQQAEMIIPSDQSWYRRLYSRFENHLLSLDKDPTPLHQHLEDLRDRRLGAYFESLWRFYFQYETAIACLRANEQLQHPDTGQTHGELDFIVQESERRKISHWEVAVKFYLGVGDTRQMQHWHGPGLRDRLDKKCRRMQEHQTQISQQDWVRAHLDKQSIHIDDARIILKGRLFYPQADWNNEPNGSVRGHHKGFWCSTDMLMQHVSADDLMVTLTKRQWLAPVSVYQFADEQIMRADQLVQELRQRPLDRPICVAVLDGDDEKTRGFIVPNDWSKRATEQTY